MKKSISLILILTLLAPPVFGLVRRDVSFRPRTDRHNNPTAMIWTPAVEQFFRARGYPVKKGESFPDTARYHTLDMTAAKDPVKATIEYIDAHGFYAPWGEQRWEHTAMSSRAWHRLTFAKKAKIIQSMYNKENGTRGAKFKSSYAISARIKHHPRKGGIQAPNAIAAGKDKTKQFLSRPPHKKRQFGELPQGRPAGSTSVIPAIKENFKQIVFSQTFTEADSDIHGNIKCFTWTNRFQKGDIIKVAARLPQTGQEIYIYRGPNRTPKWKTTTNGYFRGTVEHVPAGKSYYIWLEKGKNIEAQVIITRQVSKES